MLQDAIFGVRSRMRYGRAEFRLSTLLLHIPLKHLFDIDFLPDNIAMTAELVLAAITAADLCVRYAYHR